MNIFCRKFAYISSFYFKYITRRKFGNIVKNKKNYLGPQTGRNCFWPGQIKQFFEFLFILALTKIKAYIPPPPLGAGSTNVILIYYVAHFRVTENIFWGQVKKQHLKVKFWIGGPIPITVWYNMTRVNFFFFKNHSTL